MARSDPNIRAAEGLRSPLCEAADRKRRKNNILARLTDRGTRSEPTRKSGNEMETECTLAGPTDAVGMNPEVSREEKSLGRKEQTWTML